jgi:hypothetical protein
MRDGRAESRDPEAYLRQYVEGVSGEPARLAPSRRSQPCRSGISAVAVEVIVNNAGWGTRGFNAPLA